VRSVAVKFALPPVLGVLGLGLIVAGVALVLGPGWALIAAGIGCLAVAVDWQAAK
jgi:hypothetical protein